MRKIVFLTGTRADYGKIKSILKVIHARNGMEVDIFVTGMHMLAQFGNTYAEVVKDGLGRVHCDEDYAYEPRMDMAIANVIRHFSRFVRKIEPDMIVVHGDRLDALAGAIVGAFNNIMVAHIEGGEVSGTIDESIRHAISKFAHIHFVANAEARQLLLHLGEKKESIHIIGSPDVDVMLGDSLPDIDKVKTHYTISFDQYAILLYHPVVTELERLPEQVEKLIKVLKGDQRNYVIIYPNNDPGNEIIRRAYEVAASHERFHLLPSMRFEYFLMLLKHAEFIIGNSSAGIREACVYGIPAIDIGSRQYSRCNLKKMKNVIHVEYEETELKNALGIINKCRHQQCHFGSGGSAEAFYSILENENTWMIPLQKYFIENTASSLSKVTFDKRYHNECSNV